tara:strand:+ start:2781 stop:3020 length:240 start_codon:yes stop_codon:yes gene_type:complete
MIDRDYYIDNVYQGKHEVNWQYVRQNRDAILTQSDWRFMSDQTPSQEWIDYRQFLRDLPQQFTEANDAADAWNQYIIPE